MMKKRVLAIILASVMLFCSLPMASAAYEEYLPTVQGFETEQVGELTKCIVLHEARDKQDLPIYLYVGLGTQSNCFIKGSVPRDTFDLGEMGMFCSQTDTYPIVAGIDSNETWDNIMEQDTGYSMYINVLPSLNIPNMSEVVVGEDFLNFGTGYPVGQYEFIINPPGYGTSIGSFIGEVTATNQELILYGYVRSTLQEAWGNSEYNTTFQRATFLGFSDDGRTANYEVTLAQAEQETETPVAPSEPTTPEAPAPEYIYGETDPGASLDFAGMLDDVTDETGAVDAVEQALSGLTSDQTQSATGIDRLTLLAEEAAAKANTQTVTGGTVNVTAADIPATVGSALDATTGVLTSAGLETQRNPRTILNYDTGDSETVSVSTEALPETVDKVRVSTSYAAATVDAQQASNFTMTSRGSQTIEVNFDTGSETMVTVSFPGISADDLYMAVVDEDGNPVGGKYNPATGTLEAKLTESGVYSVVNNEKDFADIKDKSQEMQQAIKLLASKGIISGTTETTFTPDSTISRAETTALLMRTLSLLDPNADGGFADVTPANWYCAAAGSAKEHGIISGYEDNTFRGTAVIAKDQIVSVAARTLREQMDYKTPSDVNGELAVYTDAASIASWAREDVALATMTNLVLKQTDGGFSGSAGMTRGDAAIIMQRLFDKLW